MKFVAFLFRTAFIFRYRISIKGRSIMKQKGAKLFLPNHQALVDPQIIVACEYKYQPIAPVLSASFYNIPLLKWFFQCLNAVPVNDLGAGSRDSNVLNFIYSNVEKALKEGRNVLLYPSGQLTTSGLERINNKQSAWLVTKELPDNARIIGVRVHGLWGSMWSKSRTGKTPNFLWLFVKSWFIVFANLLFFVPKRDITLEFVDITEDSKKFAEEGRKEYNKFLEDFYNHNGEETLNEMGHYFFLSKGV